ncbi:zinc finger protein 271-like [Bactrocera oleae]|uniref:zinc finger protein 271-like n=1 Tax=Bactrocera oleae TaxID=104688 RepID=UPI00387E8690
MRRKNLKYQSKFAYSEHLEFLEKDIKYDICGHGYQLSCNLAVHLRRHVHDYTFSCGVCNKFCATSRDMKIHLRIHSDDAPNLVLDDKQFIILAEVYKEHTCLWNEKDITYRFTNRRDEAMRFVCQKFNNETGLNMTQIDLEKKVKTLRKLCSFIKNRKLVAKRKKLKYQPKFAYSEHLEFLENDVGPFDCPICKKRIHGPDAFKVHIAGHDGSIPFKCDICGHGYQLSSNLAVHLRRHVQDYTYGCNICNKLCATSTDLKTHMRSHTNEKPFVCDLCGHRTGTSSHLIAHRRRHLKRRVYKCELCPKTFYDKQILNQHTKIHSTVRDKICEICNKGFITNNKLRQHRLIHDPEKKYSCKICEKRFAQSAGLCGHMKSHGSVN